MELKPKRASAMKFEVKTLNPMKTDRRTDQKMKSLLSPEERKTLIHK